MCQTINLLFLDYCVFCALYSFYPNKHGILVSLNSLSSIQILYSTTYIFLGFVNSSKHLRQFLSSESSPSQFQKSWSNNSPQVLYPEKFFVGHSLMTSHEFDPEWLHGALIGEEKVFCSEILGRPKNVLIEINVWDVRCLRRKSRRLKTGGSWV